MVLRQATLVAIRDGTVTLAFRRWIRPTVKAGGTLLTAAGQLHIAAVDVVPLSSITGAEAAGAGYASRQVLIDDLQRRDSGDVYRIRFGALTADPRVALRAEAALTPVARAALLARLRAMDTRAAGGAWTLQVLRLIRAHPGRRAGDLCRTRGQAMLPFKADVRKLKALGLTESLEVGYRLSPRGAALLDSLDAEAPPA